jgi:RNA polymerase I-specific transcription initiation factor RRN3
MGCSVQFVMFYACSLDPDTWGNKFAVDLVEILLSTSEDPISRYVNGITVGTRTFGIWFHTFILYTPLKFFCWFRMSAISYLASYLSRAKFISSSIVASILIRSF